MTPDEIFDLIEDLHPDKNKDITEALAFIRLVVKNNPKKTAAQIYARSDVKEALGVLEDWSKKALEASKQVVVEVPKKVATEVVDQATETVTGIVEDVRPTETTVEKWREDDPTAWAAQIILRMAWFVEWLLGQANTFLLTGKYKRWVSRLAPNTCKFCRALHGTVVPIYASFAPAAIAAGYPKKYIYAGLFSPPLHPRCQCTCVSVNRP